MRYLRTIALLLGTACSDSTSSAPEPVHELPPNLHVEGSAAETHPDGTSVTCSFSLVVIWDSATRSGSVVTYMGRMGGESSRMVLDADGAGLGFFADMAWPTAAVRVIDGDSVSMNMTEGTGPSGSPFWDAFRSIEGRKLEGQWSGPWTCLPLGGEAGSGYVDTTGTAAGSWQLMAPFVAQP